MFLKIGAIILAGYVAVFGLFVVVALQSGIAIVSVQDHHRDKSFFIPIPMVLGNVGLALLPDSALSDVRRQIGPHRKIVEAAIQELRNCPDSVFVEVEGKREHVRVEKSGDNLVINVESNKEDVYVRVPLKSTQKMIAQLAGPR